MSGGLRAPRSGRARSSGVVAVGRSSGFIAIRFLLRYLRRHGTGDLRRLSDRRSRRSSSRSCCRAERGGLTVEVMKQLRQRAIRDLLDQRAIRTQQELAAALRERGFRATQATISRDVAELGLDQGRRARGRRPTRCRRGSSRPRPPARTACASCCADLPDRDPRVRACCSSCARCPAPPTRSPRRSTARAGPRSPGRIAGDDTLFVAFPDRGSLQRIRRRLLRLTEQSGLTRRV